MSTTTAPESNARRPHRVTEARWERLCRYYRTRTAGTRQLR